MLYDLLLAKSLNGGGGGGGSAAPLFVEFASDEDYNWDENGHYEFQELTCSEELADVAAAIEVGRVVYASFTESHNVFSGSILEISSVGKNDSGKLMGISFEKTIMWNHGNLSKMEFFQVGIGVYENEENPGEWLMSGNLYAWEAQTYIP